MNWKTEAAEKLRQYDAMGKATVNLPLELRRLRSEATAIRGAKLDSAAGKSAVSAREERLLSNLVHQQELQWRLEQAKSWVDVTERALSAADPEQRLVLQRLFIYPEKGAVERLCQELGVEKSTVYRLREQALHTFTTALYGSVDS